MVFNVIGFLFWKRKLREMPRKPDTLAGVIAYLCGNHFLADFRGCNGSKEGRSEIERAGKMYGFGPCGRRLGIESNESEGG